MPAPSKTFYVKVRLPNRKRRFHFGSFATVAEAERVAGNFLLEMDGKSAVPHGPGCLTYGAWVYGAA